MLIGGRRFASWPVPPTAMISDTLAIAAVTGGVCLAAQAWFTLLFARLLPDGPWRSQPAFAAHQAVALPLMILVSVLGCMAWLAPESPHATPHERIYGPCAAGEQLAAVLLGGLVLWDIPLTSLPSIYSPAAMGHHVVTSVLALLALRPYCAYYAPFFAGVIEISSVPLVFVDLFHPKHLQALAEASPALSALNGAARAAFAASFLVLRTACFPLVVFTQV